MVPMLPDSGIFYYFNSYFEWDKANGVLYIAANNHTITFTMGSSNASVDGVTTALGCTPYLLDGVPMALIDALVNAFDFTVTYGSNTITTTWEIFYNMLNSDSNNLWKSTILDFPKDGHLLI
jgi:Copper amine oxidase N-terminal domain.